MYIQRLRMCSGHLEIEYGAAVCASATGYKVTQLLINHTAVIPP